MKMKALKDFRGRVGEGTSPAVHGDRFVEAGCEFQPTDAARAAWLEGHGFAIPASAPVVAPVAREPALVNAAAEAGPLPSAGGETGAATPVSSSPAAPARKTRSPAKPKAAAGS